MATPQADIQLQPLYPQTDLDRTGLTAKGKAAVIAYGVIVLTEPTMGRKSETISAQLLACPHCGEPEIILICALKSPDRVHRLEQLRGGERVHFCRVTHNYYRILIVDELAVL